MTKNQGMVSKTSSPPVAPRVRKIREVTIGTALGMGLAVLGFTFFGFYGICLGVILVLAWIFWRRS